MSKLGGKQAGAALHTSEEIGAIPSATRLCVSEFFRKPGLCRAALALAILAVAVLSDPPARTDRRARLAPVDGRRWMALDYERIQSSGSDRMEEPARKCQPIGDSVWRSFQARSVCRTLKRGPHAWGQLYSHGIDDSSQFWQVPYWRAVGSPPPSTNGRQRDQGLLPIRCAGTGPDPRV